LTEDDERLGAWLAAGQHGTMDYMARPLPARARSTDLFPGARSVLLVALDHLPLGAAPPHAILADPERAYLARYGLGRDYHKVIRGRLKVLAARLVALAGSGHCRVCADSAPLLERALGRRSHLGFVGKNTCLIRPDGGSFFLIGAILTDVALPPDPPPPLAPQGRTIGCGTCARCITACPTGAIVAPFVVDARRCISYLTIELHGPIPVALRPLLGNRVFGCDDCQLVCPWNRFATSSPLADFAPRHGLDAAPLVQLFAWEEEEFLRRTAGSPLRRLGHARFLRNLAVALGNGPATPQAQAALAARAHHENETLREHVAWALVQLALRADGD
jgi:epoxyqueuosine reductase